ncbi:uncharacterized protein LOC143216672 [Lasioglossum baleicum]|uniref:uncharacterized protein LOC143216672 n=1 Tax=Lasioglossum baleicum TaxID=434251 RepID=UPI003FCD192A
MCDHCSTYKPLLEQRPAVPYYPPTGPGASLQGGPVPFPAATPVGPAIDTGCCSWARDCCGGGCCAGTRCCAPPEPVPDLSQLQSPLGYGCGPPLPSYNQPGSDFPSAMNAGFSRENDMRVPCVTTKKEEPNLPKCFGGDCQDSEDCGSDGVSTV